MPLIETPCIPSTWILDFTIKVEFGITIEVDLACYQGEFSSLPRKWVP